MALTKENVVKITTNERVIRRLLAQGFRVSDTSAAGSEEGDTLALLTVSQLKLKLDERGIVYKRSARKADLVRLLMAAEEEQGSDKNI